MKTYEQRFKEEAFDLVSSMSQPPAHLEEDKLNYFQNGYDYEFEILDEPFTAIRISTQAMWNYGGLQEEEVHEFMGQQNKKLRFVKVYEDKTGINLKIESVVSGKYTKKLHTAIIKILTSAQRTGQQDIKEFKVMKK